MRRPSSGVSRHSTLCGHATHGWKPPSLRCTLDAPPVPATTAIGRPLHAIIEPGRAPRGAAAAAPPLPLGPGEACAAASAGSRSERAPSDWDPGGRGREQAHAVPGGSRGWGLPQKRLPPNRQSQHPRRLPRHPSPCPPLTCHASSTAARKARPSSWVMTSCPPSAATVAGAAAAGAADGAAAVGAAAAGSVDSPSPKSPQSSSSLAAAAVVAGTGAGAGAGGASAAGAAAAAAAAAAAGEGGAPPASSKSATSSSGRDIGPRSGRASCCLTVWRVRPNTSGV